MKILVINGPNLNMLGRRDSKKYGTITLLEINEELKKLAEKLNCQLEPFQSNHEGAIIDFLQKDSSREADGVLVNPGALIRFAFCFRQALVDLNKPVMEIHMSDINKTGVNKKVNVLEDIRIGQVTGLKKESYFEGLKQLVNFINNKL
ncbi:MAG: type II 3-dehydroquinate dehydratase [Patescibacteria group bacterium]